MTQSDEEKRREREYRRRIIEYWKLFAKALKSGSDVLQKEARREALLMIEDSARTQEDYKKVIIIWDEVDRIEKWRVGKYEKQSADDLMEYEMRGLDTIIPPPFDHPWWRQLFEGDFIDVIHDCPHEIHELTASRPVHDFTKELDENRKEILYYWVIRQWTPQKIADMRGQTDRNIRKVYHKMIDEISYKIFKRLYPRYEEFLPLTVAQIAFVEQSIDKYGEGKIKEKITHKEITFDSDDKK